MSITNFDSKGSASQTHLVVREPVNLSYKAAAFIRLAPVVVAHQEIQNGIRDASAGRKENHVKLTKLKICLEVKPMKIGAGEVAFLSEFQTFHRKVVDV